MIVPIPSDEIPPAREADPRLSKLRAFAEEAVSEFAKSGEEAAQVTGFPGSYKTSQIMAQMRNAIYRQDLRFDVKATQRKSSVYLERRRP